MCPAKNFERLIQFAHIGKRAPIGAKQRGILRMLKRCLLQHRNRLNALAAAAQSLRVGDRGGGTVRVGTVTRRQRVGLRRHSASDFALGETESASVLWPVSESTGFDR